MLRLSSDDTMLLLRSFFDCSSIANRRTNEGWTKDNRRMIEDRTRTDRRPIEDRTRNYRRPIESRTHPEWKQSDSIRKNAPKDTTFIQKSRHKTVKSIQKSRLTPVKQPEQRTPVQRAASLLAIYYTDGVIINRHVPSLSTRCTYPLVVNCFTYSYCYFCKFSL